MKITKPNITEGNWSSIINDNGELIVKCSDFVEIWCGDMETSDSEIHANHEAISAVPYMIDELISDYEAFEWMYEHNNEAAVADYCHDKMESVKQTLIKLGCTYE